jgi:serine/threonine-protein kinase
VPRKDPLLGRTIAERYRLISHLGSGGMASVYLARHALIERLSAIKILHTALGRDDVAKRRFLREARAVNRINHPNIVEITDYGEGEGLVWLVMEYVPGEPLARVIGRAPLGWRRAAGIGLQLAGALGRAHQMGVIHRDLKPGNILLVPRRGGEESVKIGDFGVAKVSGAGTLTGTDVALGTPGYVAPEYREFGSCDGRSDLFSLGVVLYEAACGALPFAAPGPGQRIAETPAAPLRDADPKVPSFFDDVLATLLARDPDDRPRDGFEVVEMLERALAAPGALSPRLPALGATPPPMAPTPPPQTQPPTTPYTMPPVTTAPAADETPLPGRHPRGPHLTTAPFERVAPACVRALRTAEAWAASAPEPLGEVVVADLAQAARLVGMVVEIGELAARDHRALEGLQARGRTERARLGLTLDEAARAHSRALGWAGTLAERHWAVQTRRESGEHPLPQVDAMVWEQAALRHEEDRLRSEADVLAERIRVVSAEIARQNQVIEHDLMVGAARLEGHVGALRAVALEAWGLLAAAAIALGRDPAEL